MYEFRFKKPEYLVSKGQKLPDLVMVYSTEKPGDKKPKKYYDYVLTHMEMHAVLPRNPAPLIRQMEKSSRNRKTMQAFTTDVKVTNLDKGEIEVAFDLLPDEAKIMENKARKEKKIFRVWMPPWGLIVYPSKDLKEFFKANPQIVKKNQPKAVSSHQTT